MFKVRNNGTKSDFHQKTINQFRVKNFNLFVAKMLRVADIFN